MITDETDHHAVAGTARRRVRRPSRWRLLVLAPGVLFLAVFIGRARGSTPGFSGFTLFDDAMISMTYGRTLAQHGEWVWFPGAARVQGFTNPLWTLYMAVLHLLGLEGSTAALAVSLTSAVLVLGCAFLVYRLVRVALGGQPYADWTALAAAGTVPFAYPLTLWSLRGMEVGLLALLSLGMVAGAVAAMRRWAAGANPTPSLLALGGAAVLGIATRLDFALLAAVVGLLVFVWAPDGRARARVVVAAGTPMVVAGAAVLVFQKSYYGDWLPNTYRLKMEGTPTSERLLRGVVASGKVLPITVVLLVAVVVVLRTATDPMAKRIVILLGSVWISAFAYSVWVGGDAWEWARMANRYLAVGLPAVIGVVFIGVAQLVQRRVEMGSGSVVALLVIVASGLAYGAKTNPFTFDPRDSVAVALGLAAAGSVLWIAVKRASTGSDRGAVVVALIAGFLVIMVAISALPASQWVKDAGIHVHDDALMTARALELRAATDDRAVIATDWAGAPGYYSERSMIDLLGKSDRRIAASPPRRIPNSAVESFFPGHDKWDDDYSIGTLQPDIVFGLALSASQQVDYGYELRCLSDGSTAYVLRSSRRVDVDALSDCP